MPAKSRHFGKRQELDSNQLGCGGEARSYCLAQSLNLPENVRRPRGGALERKQFWPLPTVAPIAGADPQVTAALRLATWAGLGLKGLRCREPAARPDGAVAELGRPLVGLRHRAT